MTDITDRLRTWCHAPNAASAQDLMDEASVEIGRLRDALKYSFDQRDLLAVKVSQWEASYVLTAEERESVKEAIVALRSLLERLK
jgi:hypothetical protein